MGEEIFHTYLLKLCLCIITLSSFYEDDTTDLQPAGHLHLVTFLELRENLCESGHIFSLSERLATSHVVRGTLLMYLA